MPYNKYCSKCKKVMQVPTWKYCQECTPYHPKTRYQMIEEPVIKIKDDDIYMYIVDEHLNRIGYMTKKTREKNLTEFYNIRNNQISK